VLVRFAVLGTALIAATGAWLLHAHAPRESQRAYTQLNGSTDQRFPIWALQRAGAVRRMFVMWHPECTGAAIWRWSAREFNGRYRFRRRGREFSVGEAHDGPRDGDWSSRVSLSVNGALSANGLSASGTLHGHVKWSQAGRTEVTCDTGPVGWHVAAPQ